MCISKNFNAYIIIYILKNTTYNDIVIHTCEPFPFCVAQWSWHSRIPQLPGSVDAESWGVFLVRGDSDADTKPYYVIISDDFPKDSLYRKKGPDFQDFYNLFLIINIHFCN